MVKEKREKEIYLRCQCGCGGISACKTIYSDDDISYNISFLNSSLVSNNFSIINRIKNAFKILCGKPIYFADVFYDKDCQGGIKPIETFIKDMQELLEYK